MAIEGIPTSPKTNTCERDKQEEQKEMIFQKERVIYAVAAALLMGDNGNNEKENQVIEKMDCILNEVKDIEVAQYDKRRQNSTKFDINGSNGFAKIGALFLPPNSSAQEAPVGRFIAEIANYSEIKPEYLSKIRDRVSDLCFGDEEKLKRFDEVISQRLS